MVHRHSPPADPAAPVRSRNTAVPGGGLGRHGPVTSRVPGPGWRAAALLALTLLAAGWSPAGSAQTQAQTQVRQLRDSVNALRAAAGLPALRLDDTLTAGCTAHARYMVLNRDVPALDLHQHRPGRPGSSALPEAAACAEQSVLAPRTADLPSALAAWMGGLYHRRPILSPKVSRMGVGTAALPDGGIAAALMLPEENTWEPDGPVLWPPDGQTDVPLDFATGEVPSPIPGPVKTGGYPVTLFFPGNDPVDIVAATLSADGRTVPVHLSSPARPVTPFSRYGVVSLIPKAPLLAQTTYSVRITTELAGRRSTVQGSFTTAGLTEVDAADIPALLRAVNTPSRVAGTVKHGGTMQGNSGPQVFLQFEGPAGGPLVSVIVPQDIWRQLGENGGDPAAWRGYALQVDATPSMVGARAINLRIGSVRQFMTGTPR